ncbi:hypothetical protein CGRA01v4_02896 [Colletotrichum graminicola]|nr:hypothetical protein CGRA01v4_02896 [Colletotrichum graminicola]
MVRYRRGRITCVFLFLLPSAAPRTPRAPRVSARAGGPAETPNPPWAATAPSSPWDGLWHDAGGHYPRPGFQRQGPKEGERERELHGWTHSAPQLAS